MSERTRLRPIAVAASNPGAMTGRGNNTWLLDGAEPALIDAGVGVASHIDAVARHLGGRPLVRVLVTHGHPDHASGVPALQARWPALQAWKWSDDANPSWHALSAVRSIKAGDTPLEVIHTPGHAPDHACFWHQAGGELFVGDMLVVGSTVVIPAGRGGHLRSYLSSLERLAALDARVAYPGHGAVIERPNELVAEYLAHRQLRDRQVRACLEAGMATVDDIVARIYPDLSPALVAAARQTVEAHLEKLHEDGFMRPPGP